MKGRENGTSLLEGLHMFVLIVRGAILPATEQDADPLEGQRSDHRVIFFAFGGVVVQVITRPLAVDDRKARKFMEGLPDKFRAGVPEVHHSGFAAAFGDGTDPGEVLNVLCRLIARTIRAKEGTEPRG